MEQEEAILVIHAKLFPLHSCMHTSELGNKQCYIFTAKELNTGGKKVRQHLQIRVFQV